MTELRNDLIIYFWIMVGVAIVGFCGWLTDYDPEPVKYQIQQRWMGDNLKGVEL